MACDTRIAHPTWLLCGLLTGCAATLLSPASSHARRPLPDRVGREVIVRFRDGAAPDAASRALGAPPTEIRRVVPERFAIEERLRTSPFPHDAGGRVIVGGRPYPSLADVPADEMFAAAYADMPAAARALYRSHVLSLPATIDVESALGRLAADPDVEYAEPNYLNETSLVPSDPLYPQQWAHHMTDAEGGWDVERGDPAVVIAVIDTGVDYAHPDLAPNVWTDGGGNPGRDEVDIDRSAYRDAGYDLVSGEDYVDPDGDPADAHGHGTHVAGIAAARGDDGIGVAGVCHGCRIMPVRAGFVIAADGEAYGVLENDDVARAITWAADHGARILNMSFGGFRRSQAIEDAITYAHDVKGVIPVAAAGNAGIEWPSYPASLDHVISVASIGVDGGRSWFSNYGYWVDVAAPGGGGALVLSTVPPAAAAGDPSGYRGFQGTSMASPYVAGLAGLLLSRLPGLDTHQVALIMSSTADPPLSDEYVGGGRVNVARALGVAGPSMAEATITFPEPRDAVIDAPVSVVGTASGTSYRLEVGEHVYAGPWTLLATGTAVANGVLGVLDPATLVPGRAYYLRLTVTDTIELSTVVPIYAGWRQAVEARLSPATAVDLDGDGAQEVVLASHHTFGADPTRLYVWRADGQPAPGFPIDVDGATDPFIPPPAVGDLDGDGDLEIVHTGRGGISIFNHDGTPHLPWPAPIFTNEAATLVDLDGDGDLEIVVPAGWAGETYLTSALWAWHHDGAVVSGFPVPMASATSVAAGDLDGDGRPELAFVEHRPASEIGRVHVVRGDGSPMPGWPREAPEQSKWTLYGNPPPMLADVDGDGDLEIVVTLGLGQVTIWHHDGTVVTPLLAANVFTPPALVDLDQDGDLEIVYAESLIRYDNWILAFHHDATPVAGWPAVYPSVSLDEDWVGAMIVSGDLDGDGTDEVVAKVWDRVFAWHGDGTLVDGFPLSAPDDPIYGPNFRYEYPALADLDADGRLDVVVPTNFSDVYRLELPAAAGTPSLTWPMYQHDPAHSGLLPPHCGNGTPDPGEQCDDAGDSPLCNRNCRVAACGDGVRNQAAGEECDGVDGADAGCCTAACVFEPSATPCDDGNPCTQADGCAAGVCAGATEPADACREPLRAGASSLKVVHGGDETSHRVSWKTKASSATVADLGDPPSSTSYRLCVYDRGAAPARTTMQRTIAAGGTCKGRPCWKALGTKGFRYVGGVETLKLKVSSSGQATVAFKGKGVGLDPPPLPAVPDVVVQLHNVENGVCWSAAFEGAIGRNDGAVFQARSD